MKFIHSAVKGLFITLFTVLFVNGCATTSYIDIKYHLPPSSTTLAGKTIFVEIHDGRMGQALFGPAAQKTFKQFTGKFSLTLARENIQGIMMGAFDLMPLFRETVLQYLQNMGARVPSSFEKNQPHLKIDITSFHMEIIGRKWVSDITYDAYLIKDHQIRAKQSVRGQAERAKIIGSAQGQAVIGEIFTDVINQLNMENLFREAKL